MASLQEKTGKSSQLNRTWSVTWARRKNPLRGKLKRKRRRPRESPRRLDGLESRPHGLRDRRLFLIYIFEAIDYSVEACLIGIITRFQLSVGPSIPP